MTRSQVLSAQPRTNHHGVHSRLQCVGGRGVSSTMKAEHRQTTGRAPAAGTGIEAAVRLVEQRHAGRPKGVHAAACRRAAVRLIGRPHTRFDRVCGRPIRLAKRARLRCRTYPFPRRGAEMIVL